MDSDDWIEENCLKEMTEKLVDDIDILQILFKRAYEDGTEVEISLFKVKYRIKNWILYKLVVVDGRHLTKKSVVRIFSYNGLFFYPAITGSKTPTI